MRVHFSFEAGRSESVPVQTSDADAGRGHLPSDPSHRNATQTDALQWNRLLVTHLRVERERERERETEREREDKRPAGTEKAARKLQSTGKPDLHLQWTRMDLAGTGAGSLQRSDSECPLPAGSVGVVVRPCECQPV
jgi:hypothetical protein